MKTLLRGTGALLAALLTSLLAGCASGPVQPVPPTVEVADFNSVLITPESVKFVGRIRIHNRMRGPLDVARVDYAADLHDQPLFDRTFDRISTMRSRSTTTVTLPFTVEMQRIGAQVEDVIVEESVRVQLHGVVHPVGFPAIPFRATKVLPIPRLPEIAVTGVRGNPVQGEFSVSLKVKNTNPFPVSYGSIDTWLELNDRRYDLLRTDSFTNLAPGHSGPMTLAMQQAHNKGLGILVNIARNRGATDFTVTGQMRCNTPHGVIQMPVKLASNVASPGR